MSGADENSKDAQRNLDALADEITDQFRGGGKPRVRDYIRRYPQFANELEKIFTVIASLQASRADGPGGATNGEDDQ